MEDFWHVYMIKTVGSRLYTGIAKNVGKRFEDHKLGKGAKFFRMDPPEQIVFQETFDSKGKALTREAEIKTMKREEKEKLVGSYRSNHQNDHDRAGDGP